MLKVLSYILCDLDPKVKVIGQKAGICDGVPSTSALVLFTFSFTFRKHTGNIGISEIAISNLLRKSNVPIESSLVLRTTNAVLELVTI